MVITISTLTGILLFNKGKTTVTPAQTKAITYTFIPLTSRRFLWRSEAIFLGKKGMAYKKVTIPKAKMINKILSSNCQEK